MLSQFQIQHKSLRFLLGQIHVFFLSLGSKIVKHEGQTQVNFLKS
jgi:hypothetical protein